MRKPLALLAAVIVAGIVLIAPPASAHHVTVTGQAVCDTTTGAFDVTWTITNSESDKVMTYSTDRLGGGTVAPSGSASLSEGDVPAGTYTLSVDASWPNGVTSHDTGTVVAGGDCELPPPPDECPDIPGDQPPGTDCVQPPPVVDKSSESSYKCGDDYKTITTRTSTTEYVWNGNEWVLGEPVVETTSEQVPVPVVDCNNPPPPPNPPNPPNPPDAPRPPTPPVTTGVPTDIDGGL